MCRPFRKAAGFRRAAPPKAAGFPCAAVSARRPAFAAPSHSQGGGFSMCRVFRKAAGFPCAVRFARRTAFAAPPHSQGGGVFRVRSVPQGGGFPARGSPKRRAFRARSVPQGGGFPSCGHHAGRLALAAPAGGGPAVQPSSRSSQAVHTPRSDVQDGHTHCPQPGQSVRQRVSSMRAQREHWACAKAIHLLFASPLGLVAARPLVCPEGGKNARGLRLRGVEKGEKKDRVRWGTRS